MTALWCYCIPPFQIRITAAQKGTGERSDVACSPCGRTRKVLYHPIWSTNAVVYIPFCCCSWLPVAAKCSEEYNVTPLRGVKGKGRGSKDGTVPVADSPTLSGTSIREISSQRRRLPLVSKRLASWYFTSAIFFFGLFVSLNKQEICGKYWHEECF